MKKKQLDFLACKEILEKYKINITGKPVYNIEEAIKCSNEIGFPIVLKLISPEIIHKSDLGFVKLNINNKDDLVKSYNEIIKNAEKLKIKTKSYILLQEMCGP